MDLKAIADRLIEKHSRMAERLTLLLRRTAHEHYCLGIQHIVQALQEQAVADHFKEQPNPNALTGPLAVQASHSAQEGVSESKE